MNGQHATMINGKGSGIAREDLLAVASRAGLPARAARTMLDEVEGSVREALGKLG